MVCCHNVGIKNQSMESPGCHCEVEEEEQDDQKCTSDCEWNEQSYITVTAFCALGAAQNKTKSFFTLSTQQPTTVETTLRVRLIQVDVLAITNTVVKWAKRVMDKTF